MKSRIKGYQYYGKFGWFQTNKYYNKNRFYSPIWKCHTGCGKVFSNKTLKAKGLRYNPFDACPFCGNKI